MANTTSTQTSTQAPPAAPAPLFGVFLILWLGLALALIFNQDALDSVRHWLIDLPLLIQIAVWVLFLPVVLGLWVWESDWMLWLRLVIILALAVSTLAAFGPKPGGRPRHD
jgi:hypothetical protein